MASLSEVVKDPERRRKVIDDCVALIDAEVADKRGLTGVALKTGYAAVKGVKPGIIPTALHRLLDDFAAKVDPFWQEALASGNPRSHFVGRRDAIANALLGITDARAAKVDNRVIAGAYQRLRPQAVSHVADALPRLADLLAKHAG